VAPFLCGTTTRTETILISLFELELWGSSQKSKEPHQTTIGLHRVRNGLLWESWWPD
jgi:hypothetical protein